MSSSQDGGNVNKPTVVDTGVNNAKMREACEMFVAAFIETYGGMQYVNNMRLAEAYRKAKAALAAPARNCDRMNKEAEIGRPSRNCDRFETAEEADAAYRMFYEREMAKIPMDAIDYGKEWAKIPKKDKWLFAPATEKEGAADGNK